MQRRYRVGICAVGCVMTVGASQAALVNGTEIIAAPSSVLANGATNGNPQAFNEKQAVVLSRDIATDNGIIAAGTVVDSHLIFLNPSPGNTINYNGAWFLFDGPILGVLSDTNGGLELASNAELGLGSVAYPSASYAGRGLEPGTPLFPFGTEGYSVRFDRLSISLTGSDYLRVVTASQGSANQPPVVDPSATPDQGVAPLAINFQSNASDPDGDPLTFAWNFGDGESSADENPVHTYQTPGTYTAQVTVSDAIHSVSGQTVVVVGSPLGISVSQAKANLKNAGKASSDLQVQAALQFVGDLSATSGIGVSINGVRFLQTTLASARSMGSGQYDLRTENLRLSLNLLAGDLSFKISDPNVAAVVGGNDVVVTFELNGFEASDGFPWEQGNKRGNVLRFER